MRSLYKLSGELYSSQKMLKTCMDEFGEPNGWDRSIAYLQKEIEAAKQEEPDENLKSASTKSLVWAVMDIGERGKAGRKAELELLRRLSLQRPAESFQGPAHLVLVENGQLNFSSIDPFERASGIFLAYDVGIYD